MADKIPLIVNTAASQIQELASTDNLTFASKLLITNSTDSTSKDTGSTIIDGGVGIEKNLHVGGTGTFTGNVTAPTFVGNLNGIASNSTLVDLNNDTGSTFRQLVFTSSTAATTGAQLLIDNASGSATGDGIQFRPSDNTLRVDGDIIAYHTSDSRLKENLERIKDPIAKIMGISGYTFTWKEEDVDEWDYIGSSNKDTGVIAQEIEALGLPDLVKTRTNGVKAVRYQKLVALLIEAIKELKTDIDQLKTDFIRHNHD